MSDNVTGTEYNAALALTEISNDTIEIDNAAKVLIEMKNNVHAVWKAALNTDPKWSEDCKRKRTSGHLALHHEQEDPAREEGSRHVINAIGGAYDIQVLATKNLYHTHVESKQNSINIGRHPEVPEFLRAYEKERLMHNWDCNSPRPGIPVTLIEPCGQQSKITLKIWKTGGKRNPTYVLTTEWGSVVERNTLAAGDKLLILSFRYGDGQLGIALVKNPTGVTK